MDHTFTPSNTTGKVSRARAAGQIDDGSGGQSLGNRKKPTKAMAEPGKIPGCFVQGFRKATP